MHLYHLHSILSFLIISSPPPTMSIDDIRVISLDANHANVLAILGRRLFSGTFSHATKPSDMKLYLDESYTPEVQLKELNDCAPSWL